MMVNGRINCNNSGFLRLTKNPPCSLSLERNSSKLIIIISLQYFEIHFYEAILGNHEYSFILQLNLPPITGEFIPTLHFDVK